MSVTRLQVRPGRPDDLDAMFALALQTGGGFTNLPPDRAALAHRLERSAACFAGHAPAGAAFILVLEALDSGRVVGTANLFPQIGAEWPF